MQSCIDIPRAIAYKHREDKMNSYFLQGPDIGYNDMGLFTSKYHAVAFARKIAQKANNGKTYYVHNANDMVLASVRATPKAPYKWITNDDL